MDEGLDTSCLILTIWEFKWGYLHHTRERLCLVHIIYVVNLLVPCCGTLFWPRIEKMALTPYANLLRLKLKICSRGNLELSKCHHRVSGFPIHSAKIQNRSRFILCTGGHAEVPGDLNQEAEPATSKQVLRTSLWSALSGQSWRDENWREKSTHIYAHIDIHFNPQTHFNT